MQSFLPFTKTRIRTAELKKKQSIVPAPKNLLSKERRNNRQINRQMGDKQGNGQTCSFSRVVSDPSEHSVYLFSIQFLVWFGLSCSLYGVEYEPHKYTFERKYDKELRANPGLVPSAVGDKATSCFLENLTGGWGRVASLKDCGNKGECV